ncbi:MAG TPA: S-adenosylmethionine:tRNA ribosyltransferase-isomerase, partial [Acidimicrobiales bacterium]|nr:S-adenosylmethionine:tRNA ribosyltransferase-isomerase [Acidimicrobiales bacterium]
DSPDRVAGPGAPPGNYAGDSPRFILPPELEAAEPPEARGLRRDAVRLLVARKRHGSLSHHHFTDLPSLLNQGDVVAVNTSATIPAALDAETSAGERARLHLSGRLPGGLWVVELRHRLPGPRDAADRSSTPWLDAEPGLSLGLPDGAIAVLRTPATAGLHAGFPVRLWVATIDLPESPLCYLAKHGKPIRYAHVTKDWPISYYQTVFAEVPGSAEMPSAARPFSAEVTTRLAAKGIVVAPFVLHCGVSSAESHEPPGAEWFKVPATTAELINQAHRRGSKVIAVGTTAVRALQTAAGDDGIVHPAEGWTELVINPDTRITGIDGLITGWHEPGASHLSLLQAVGGSHLVEASYGEALESGYLWHEFGDSHLILR